MKHTLVILLVALMCAFSMVGYAAPAVVTEPVEAAEVAPAPTIETITEWVGTAPESLGVVDAPAGQPGETYKFANLSEESMMSLLQHILDAGIEIYPVGGSTLELYACRSGDIEFYLFITGGSVEKQIDLTIQYSSGLFAALEAMMAAAPSSDNTPTETPAADYIATITMYNGDVMTIELYSSFAPETVANFVKLIEAKFYDGLTFHRIIPGFVIQGGDPNGDGSGGPGYAIKGEFIGNGFAANTLKHTRGVLSMARSDDPDSAGSQFFIVIGDATFLDENYAAFGKLIGEDSYATLDKIAAVTTDGNDAPLVTQVMKTMTVTKVG